MDGKLLERCLTAVHQAYTSGAHASKAVFQDPDAFASELFVHARGILGPDFYKWEPETLWRELPEVNALNRDKLLAAQALATVPSFYWDPRVYGNTVLAMNNEAVFAGRLPTHINAPALVWGTVEAEILFALHGEEAEPEFDTDVVTYVAILLFDEGYTNAPVDFADEILREHLSETGQELHAKVKAAWRAHSKSRLEADAFEDSALGVQMERQAACYLYAVKRAEDLIRRLS